MAAPRRVFFDVTFTRTQVGSVGITRTVRRLHEELVRVLGPQTPVTAVAFHKHGYRVAGDPGGSRNDTPSGRSGGLGARVLRWMPESFLRRLALSLLPLPLLYQVWKLHSSLAFDGLSAGLSPVRFRAGDLLLICDASWSHQAWLAAAAAARDGAKVVFMAHDLIPIRHPEFGNPLFAHVFRKWLDAMIPLADGVVCNSLATESDLRAYAAERQLQLPSVSHFRLGSDPVRSCVSDSVRPALAGFLDAGSPCFAVIGSVERRKNYGWLLGVLESLWSQGHEVRLLVIGRPTADAREQVERLAHHPEQGRRLLWLADASDGEVAEAYARARALLFPSLAEGFGLPLVEARTRGCPVIASDLPVFAELADRGVFLYPAGDVGALQALVLDHARHDRRASVGSMPPFTWEDSARDCLATISAMLDGSSAVAPSRTAPCAAMADAGARP